MAKNKLVKNMNDRKDSSRVTGALRRRRAKLREEAEARQAKRDKRSVEEQLMIIETRPGNSTKERKRLLND